MLLHATLVAAHTPQGWSGALLRGPSGAGKSDLAARTMALGLRLVADDRVQVWASGGRLFGRAPSTLQGLLEVRHLGVVAAPAVALAPVRLVVDLQAADARLPDLESERLVGVETPRLALAPLEAGAALRLVAMLKWASRPR